MRKWIALVLVALLSLSPLLAQGAAEEKEGEMVTVIDDRGDEVRVPLDPRRVIVTDIYPLVSVITVFLNSPDRIVGMHQVSMAAAKNGLLSQLYPAILNADTSFMTGTNLNIEEVLRLRPDVVFYNAAVPAEGQMLREAGVPAVAVSAVKWGYDVIRTYDGWIRILSAIFPERTGVAEKVASYSRKVLADVQARTASLSDGERRHALFLFNYSADKIVTSGSSFFGQYWCDATGMINSAHEVSADNANAVITMEQVYAWNPDVVFITNFTPALPSDLYDNTCPTYDWRDVEAVKRGEVYKLPLGSYRSYTPGVDTPLTLYWMAKVAYPALFADIDMKEETRSYYRDIYGVTLSDEQIETMYHSSREAGAGFVSQYT